MMGREVDHRDVGAYALGLLNPRDETEFETHLAGCELCAMELAEFTRVAAVLPDVDVESLAAAEGYDPDGRQLDRLLGRVAFQRRRGQSHRMFAAAAAVLLVAGGIAAGGVIGGLAAGRDHGTGNPGALATPTVTTAPALAGDEFRATDPVSRVDAKVWLESKKWGTQVTLSVGNVRGPLECRLVAVSRSGQRDVAMAWTVPPEGYGTAAQPVLLTLHGATALQRSDIDHVEVRTVDPAAPTGGATLVSIPIT
jgi:hypothetical protein